jgi:serine/threonine-protein kinase
MAGKMPSHIGGYQIQKQLGEGAFGRVYQAYDARVNRLVAIKVLLLTDKEVVTRFKNEAIVAGNLRHNNIVTIYEFGEHEGLPFLAMEFLDGENLQEVIRSKKPLTMLQKISIMTQIAEGLDCAHRHGVVHRDVKPANMMLLPDGTVKIMDFGIARLTGGQQATRLTQQGNVLGTLLYMAPEQFAPNTEVDALCDIFACGEVFYELLAGRHPFEANEPRILLYKVTVEDPPPLRTYAPDCPAALDQVLARMLSKPRDLRYHSLREVLFDVQPVLMDLQQERAATLMTEAQELFRQQKADAANALLPEILELDPGNRTAYRLRDQIQRELLKPKIETLLKTGREELSKRRFHEAIQAFSAAARLDSTNTEIHELLGQAKAAQEQSQRASQLVAEARVALDQTNLTGAYKNASEALLLDPENPQASRLLLVIQSAIDRKRQQQQLDEALLKAEHLLMIQAYDRALEALSGLEAAAAADDRVEQLASRIRAQKQEHERATRLAAGMASATEMLREQKLDEAVRQLTTLFSEYPDKLDVRQLLEYALKEQGAQQRAQAIAKIKTDAQALADAHDFRAALEMLDQGLQKYDDGSLVRLLGTIMAAKAAWEREEALKAARARCERLRGEGRLTDAIQAAESALRAHNADPAMKEMLRDLERAWEQAKRDEEIRATVTQARRLLESGQAEKALRFLPDAARRFPENAELQAVLAEAEQAFATEARQREVETLARDARTQAERANFDAALGALDQGIEKYPDEAALRALRDEIVQRKAVTLRRQDIQRAVQEGNRLAAEGRYPEALEIVREALGRYPGETALVQAERKLETDWERRQRELAIMEAGTQGRTLLEQGKAAEAVELLRAALEQYPAARDLESMLARAQRAAAIDQVMQEARAFMAQRDFDAALKAIEQGLRSWPGERSLAALQNEASAGLALLRREQAIRETVDRSRVLAAEGRPADALRLVDAAMRQYPGEAALVEARQEAQQRVDEAERARRRAADLDALRRLDADTRAIADAGPIRDLAEKVRALVKPYADDAEMEAAATRTLDLLGRMQDASALLARREFAALRTACQGLRAEYPEHTLFQRLEVEAARGLRQAAVQELRQTLQNEPDLEAKGKLLDEALPLYPDEAWLEQEARVVRGKLALVGTIVEKARAAATAERWDEAIDQWSSLRGIYANYPGLEGELDGARVRYLEQIRERMSMCDYAAASQAAQRAPREIAADAELQELREQIDFAQRAVQDARAAAAKQAFAQASRTLEAALGRYTDDPLLKREADAIARQAAERESAIGDVLHRAEQQPPDEALQAAEAAIAQYGEESRLLDLRRRLQTLRQAREVRSGDLRALAKLQDDARALTSSAAIAGLRQKVQSIATRYAGDTEFAQAAADIEQQLDAMQQAGVLLARREYGAVLETCSRYPEHRLLQSFKAEAARGEYAGRVAEVGRQVDEEPDLRRQAELLETALRSLPDEPSLRDRSRAVKQKLDEADTAARNARQAGQQSRWDEAIALWNRVGELYSFYPGLEAEIARLKGRRDEARAAERDRLTDQIRRRVESGDYDKANSLAELARKQFPGDPAIEELDARVQAVREIVRQARLLAPPQAIETFEAALARYPGDALIARELQTVRDESARQAQLRADAIRQAAEKIEALIAQGRAAEALKLAETSLRQYPGEARIEEAQEKVRLAQAEALRQQQRKQDLEALRRLEAEARAITDVARVAGLEGKARSIAAPYAADEEISRVAGDLNRQLTAMTEAKALLDRRDFAATLQACAAYPGHPFFARLKTETERAERTTRVAEVERQVSVEPDLMRQIELLDATIRFYPDEAALLERSRVLRSKAGQVDGIVEQARRAEQEERWDDALAQWSALGRVYKDFPGLAGEIERVTRLKRERLGDEIWQRVNTGDYDGAAELLARAQQAFPQDAELQFLREQVDSVRAIVRQAVALDAPRRIEALEAALRQYPGDKLIERTLEAARDESVRLAELLAEAIRQAAARIDSQVEQGHFAGALEMADAAIRDYPGEAGLLAARERARSAHQRSGDVEALHKLDAELRGLTDAAAIGAAREKARSLAAQYPSDEEIAHLAAVIDQQGAAGIEALEKRAAQVADVGRQVDAEPDLMLQIELLDATLRLYPDDGALLERSRVVRTKIGQVDAIVQQARQAEQAGRWDEALQQWAALEGIYREYPGLAHEIDRVRRLKREKLGDEIWQRVNTGDYDGAAVLLDRARQEFPDDAELQFLREQVEAVREIVRQARALAPAQGMAAVEAALGKYPGDKLLERELPALQQWAAQETEVREAQARVRRLAREGNHEAIVQLVRESPPHVQQDAEIRELSAAAAEVLAQRELLGQARSLTQQGQFATARQMLDRAARDYPGAAQEIARVRAEVAAAETERQAAAQMAQLTAEVDRLCAKKKYNAALRTIAESDVSGPAVAELRQRVQTLAGAVAPKQGIPKIAWIGGGAAVVALAAWGVSTLMHRDGTIVVETSPAAIVSVDKSAGTAADDKGIVTLHIPAGSHTLTVSKPGFQTAEQPLEVKSGATDHLSIALTAGKNVLTPTPVIASLDPGSVVNLGAAFTLTVSGSGFEKGTNVKWNGAALRTTHVRNTQLRAAVPANLVEKPGKAVITVANGNVSSEPVTLPINPSAPAIGSLRPTSVNAGEAGFVLRVSGTGFQPGATVDWGGTHLSTTVEGATAIRAAVPAKLIAKSGSVAVTVTNPGDVASSAVTFTVNSLAPAPTVSGLNPSTVTAGAAAFTLTVSGSNFVHGASVQWNGSPLATTVAGTAQLRVEVPASLIANAGNVRLMVVNPGNVTSPEMNLSIVAPTPTPSIGSLAPNSGTVGSAVNLTVNGSNFQQGATVEWNRSPVQTAFTSPTQLRAAIPANLLTGPGSASIVVMNPGNVASAPASFTINPPAAVPPAISGLNPSTAAAGGPQFTLVVSGSGFAQGTSVHWNRAPLSIVSANSTQLRATVPANLIAAAGSVSITVVNPDGLASGAVNFTITAPAVVPPAISSLSPNSTPAGGPALTITVTGSGFQPGSTVQWNRSPLATTFNSASQVTASVGANLTAAQGSAAITVVNPGNVSSPPANFTILPPQITQANPDVELVKSVLAEYAAAYSQKNFRKVIALFPLMPREDRGTLQDSFDRKDYTVQYSIEVTAPPVIRGDDATVSARTVIRMTVRRASAPVTKNVVITLHKGGGQWTITGFR